MVSNGDWTNTSLKVNARPPAFIDGVKTMYNNNNLKVSVSPSCIDGVNTRLNKNKSENRCLPLLDRWCEHGSEQEQI